jgi:uncharacterized membrane protein (UPF0127 family)
VRRRRAVPAPNAALSRDGETLVRVRLCRSAWEQLRGLIGCPPLPPDFGLALTRCGAVHTAFVSFPIDVLFLRAGRVLGVAEGVQPWRLARCPGASLAVELAAGSVRRLGIHVGDTLVLRLR